MEPLKTLEQEIQKYSGFPNDELAEKCSKVVTKLSDEAQCCVGLFFAMSDDEDTQAKSRSILSRLRDKHDKSPPYMLLKWILQIQNEKDINGNIEKQIEDWAGKHPDNIIYSRAVLWLKSRSKDNIELIGFYVQHLENFWKDDLSWGRLGELYAKEKLYERSTFCFDEAIGIDPNCSEYYKNAAKYRLMINSDDEETQKKRNDIAIKQLCRCVTMNEKDTEAWKLLIENTTDKAKKDKYTAYVKSLKLVIE
ncbi:hypothetical protein GPJ56_006347 [Histomonas meleagridis]|uniref:uncharacterized protein n=1 Tax=Histomonas meleagridis TaxID=135588 RepID=UPI00355A1674|nr:hypothetical protein GPJ56_006347 [Histomonas meleagridis]KAH0796836.1 hypothetical protein GO595_010729 [Histomonas meleagridis]